MLVVVMFIYPTWLILNVDLAMVLASWDRKQSDRNDIEQIEPSQIQPWVNRFKSNCDETKFNRKWNQCVQCSYILDSNMMENCPLPCLYNPFMDRLGKAVSTKMLITKVWILILF